MGTRHIALKGDKLLWVIFVGTKIVNVRSDLKAERNPRREARRGAETTFMASGDCSRFVMMAVAHSNADEREASLKMIAGSAPMSGFV